MPITLTPEEKAQLEGENFLIRPLPGASGAASGKYHNPTTGQEIPGPTDPYHLTRRLRQGWRLGPAPAELREKWLAGEDERRKADNDEVEKHKASSEYRESQAAQFNEAVTTATEVAVAAVLAKLGIDIPAEAEKVAPASAPGEVIAVLQLPEELDAATESDTKLNVSQASRPASNWSI